MLRTNAMSLNHQVKTYSRSIPREKAGIDTVSHHNRYQGIRPGVESVKGSHSFRFRASKLPFESGLHAYEK